MENQIFKTVKSSVKHWYLSLIVGVLFILLGFWILKTPMESYLTLAILFSITFLVNGVFEIIFSISNKEQIDSWGWVLASGIIDLLFGIWLVSNPGLSLAVLPFYIGFMLMFRSMSAIGYSFDMKSFGIQEWGWLLALGILGLIFSFTMIWNPVFGGLSIIFWTALAFITYGIFRVFLSFKLKKLHSITKKDPNK